MEENAASDQEHIAALKAALQSNNWDDVVMILNTHHEYVASCHPKYFSNEDSNLIAQLMYAAIDQKCKTVVQFLIEQGCDVNHGIKMPYRRHKRSLLFHASKNGHVEIVKLLLEAGAEKNCLNNTGCTALYEAVFNGHIQVVKVLLEHGCDPNIPDVYGKTPLHVIPFMSVSEETIEQCIQLLLEGGADISLKSHCGQTPADVAIQYKFCPLLKCLVKNATKLGFRTIPHNLESLSDRILPEFLLSPLNTDGVTSIAAYLIQLHPNHILNQHIKEEFIQICSMDNPPGFYATAKKLYNLMLLSGVDGLPVKMPLTLQESCRILLRRYFGIECWYKIPKLPLPPVLIDYLQLKNEVLNTSASCL